MKYKRRAKNTIGNKLMGMMLMTLIPAMFIITSSVLAHKFYSDRFNLQQQMTALANVIASRSTGALEFGDTLTAHENLSALAASADIIQAELYDQNNNVFSQFNNAGLSIKQPLIPIQHFLQSQVRIAQPVMLEGEQIGEIHILASMNRLNYELSQYILMTMTVSLLALSIAALLFYRMHRSISEPVNALLQIIRQVSIYNRYDLRVQEDYKDEMGLLNQGFNNMLQQIEIRDKQLANHQKDLQVEIERQKRQIAESHEQRIFWLETMAGFLRHELKNTTVGVTTSLDLMERRQHRNVPLDKYIQRARQSMHYMRELLQSASEASTLEAAVYKDTLKRINLSEIAHEKVAEFQSSYPDALFKQHIQSGLFIIGNSNRIQQLLDKLLSNAMDYRKQGTAIEVLLSSQSDQLILTVSNYGPALPEDKSRLFELFYSYRQVDNKQDSNVGLGLYIVKLICESHGGQVMAVDRLDACGAVFKVILPVA